MATPVSARFVRMNGLERGTMWGYSLWEFEIFDEVEDRYVAGNGVDVGNNCLDSANPCATITHAISQANPGNVIQLAAGDYTESFTIDRPLTLQGSGASGTNIQAHAQPGMATTRVFTVTAGLSVEIADVTIRHGHASGGGILNSGDSSLALTNVSINGNTAAFGGGLFNIDSVSVVLLDNSIVWGNTAANDGNEIWNDFDSAVGLRYSLYNDDPGDIVEGGEFVVRNSLTEDPLFVDAPNGVLYLQAGSPAINAGDPGTDLAIFPTDSQGNPIDLNGALRVQDGRIDMGAFEFGSSPYQLYLPLVTK